MRSSRAAAGPLAWEREPGRRFRLDGPFAVVAGRDLNVDASSSPLRVGVLDLGVRIEHVPFVVEGESEFAGGAVPFGIGGPLAVLQPRRLAPARDGALEFGVEPDAPHGGAPVEQALFLLHAGAVDGGVVRGLGRPGACEPDFLAGIHPSFGGPLPSFGHAGCG